MASLSANYVKEQVRDSIVAKQRLQADTNLIGQIADRVRRIAPFLQYDADPYAVVADGRLFWIQDAYTSSANYPYATPFGGINYIRNSVKIVIDAYHGSTAFYLWEPTDPIALTLDRIFPGMLRPKDEMPESLKSHVRYPEEIFRVQAAAFATFHMTNPQVFYTKEDQWQVPIIDDEGSATPMEPYYTIMRLPGEKETEFIQMLPFTPRLKDNLAAWMVARSDGEHRGEIVIYKLPRDRLVFGPQQIMNRINQDAEISRQVSLWDQRGSQALFGTLLVIPIEESLLYVAPLYLRSSGDLAGARTAGAGTAGRIPELKRVIVVYQNQIAMATTLDGAIASIFGGDTEVTGESQVEASHDGDADSDGQRDRPCSRRTSRTIGGRRRRCRQAGQERNREASRKQAACP